MNESEHTQQGLQERKAFLKWISENPKDWRKLDNSEDFCYCDIARILKDLREHGFHSVVYLLLHQSNYLLYSTSNALQSAFVKYLLDEDTERIINWEEAVIKAIEEGVPSRDETIV